MIESIRLLDAIADFWKTNNPPGADPYPPHSSVVICTFIHSVTLLYNRFRKPPRMAVRVTVSLNQLQSNERFPRKISYPVTHKANRIDQIQSHQRELQTP